MAERSTRICPETDPPVRVRSHPVNWELGDPSDLEFRWLSDLTFRAIQVLGGELQRECHFINPCVTISSREPTAAFFQKVIDRRGSWLSDFRESAGKYGQRQLVQLLGPSSRQSRLAGVMFIENQVTPPRTWEAMANRLLHPGDVPPYATTRCHVDLTHLKATGDHAYLKAASLAELRSHLVSNPDAALYVCPGITVVAPTPSPAFLAEARKRANEWHGKMSHALGKEKKALFRTADLPTRLLVMHGTLVIDGLSYLPGCWPEEGQKVHDLERTPFKSPSVPLGFLGINILS